MDDVVEISPEIAVVMCGWSDIPHLDEKTQRELLASFPPHERAARTQGIPGLGSGAIFPIEQSEYVVEPFLIPPYWPRAFGMDVGWNRTAAVWGTIDPEYGALVVYTEHYQGQQEPASHAAAIKARGDWIPGVIDPAANGRQQGDGQQLLAQYIDLGLDLQPAEHAVEAGIFAIQDRLFSSRLKIFSTCRNLLHEMQFYHRDDNGKVVKKLDHAIDALRYLVLSGINRATTQPTAQYRRTQQQMRGDRNAGY